MNGNSRYVAGVDIGTSSVRCIVAKLNSEGKPSIVGVESRENSGMRKGVISSLEAPTIAVEDVLMAADGVSGYSISQAAVSINGNHILSTKSEGMIAITNDEHRVYEDELERVEQAATVGKIPNNREILSFIPYSYTLDGQGDIVDPIEMTGSRLEVNANIVSAMTPHVNNLKHLAERVEIDPTVILPSVMAASNAVLTEKQKENGVAVIDLGASTTGVAIYEDGELQYLRIIPIGGINITNDLAYGLKIVPEIAEEVKIKHGSATPHEAHSNVSISKTREHYSFSTEEIDEIIEARLEEIFDEIKKIIKESGAEGKLPSGIVLVGGGANMKNIVSFTKKYLGLATQIGKIHIDDSFSKDLQNPAFAAAVGLMLSEPREIHSEPRHHKNDKWGFLSKIFKKR